MPAHTHTPAQPLTAANRNEPTCQPPSLHRPATTLQSFTPSDCRAHRRRGSLTLRPAPRQLPGLTAASSRTTPPAHRRQADSTHRTRCHRRRCPASRRRSWQASSPGHQWPKQHTRPAFTRRCNHHRRLPRYDSGQLAAPINHTATPPPTLSESPAPSPDTHRFTDWRG